MSSGLPDAALTFWSMASFQALNPAGVGNFPHLTSSATLYLLARRLRLRELSSEDDEW